MGAELWTVAQGAAPGAITVCGYAGQPKSSNVAETAWQLRHSIAGITSLPHDVTKRPIHVHVLSALHALALVTVTGLTICISVDEPSAAPLTLYLVCFLPLCSSAALQ